MNTESLKIYKVENGWLVKVLAPFDDEKYACHPMYVFTNNQSLVKFVEDFYIDKKDEH